MNCSVGPSLQISQNNSVIVVSSADVGMLSYGGSNSVSIVGPSNSNQVYYDLNTQQTTKWVLFCKPVHPIGKLRIYSVFDPLLHSGSSNSSSSIMNQQQFQYLGNSSSTSTADSSSNHNHLGWTQQVSYQTHHPLSHNHLQQPVTQQQHHNHHLLQVPSQQHHSHNNLQQPTREVPKDNHRGTTSPQHSMVLGQHLAAAAAGGGGNSTVTGSTTSSRKRKSSFT